MKRTLHLKREALAELTADELGSVAGGWAPTALNQYSCAVSTCATGLSLQARCSWSCP
ncbi:MAG TPA: hypothetical protein VFQ85_14875 [Mycobacteriales bacterium]|jgi:lactobin A/cerein 7B family class IIb bacteriocin|nr:hypothetical protein [Mycobacteriales bacterium]